MNLSNTDIARNLQTEAYATDIPGTCGLWAPYASITPL